MSEVEIVVDAGERKKLYDRGIYLKGLAGKRTEVERVRDNEEVETIKKKLGIPWLDRFTG